MIKQRSGDNSGNYHADGNMHIGNNIINSPESRYNAYKALADEFHKEIANQNNEFCEVIKKLEHYSSQKNNDKRGLKQKLIDGKYENDYDWASELKENYTKKLTETTLSPATQKIHAYLLARVYTLFKNTIEFSIHESATSNYIKRLIEKEVIQPVEDIFGIDNVLELYSDDIYAMIYFLTGNCHLKWD